MRKWGNKEMGDVAKLGRRTSSPAREIMVYSTERAVGWQDKEGRQIMGVYNSSSEGTHSSYSHQFRSKSTEPMERVWKV